MLGSPIAHSLSPVLHRAAYAELGLDWTYDAIEVDQSGLAGVRGGSGPILAGAVADDAAQARGDAAARRVRRVGRGAGAANTLVLREGRRFGFNTDVPGAVEALRERTEAPIRSAVVLGGGATAVSVLLALAELGCTRARLLVREPRRAAETLDVIGRERPGVLVAVGGLDEELGDPDVLASTIPAAAQTERLVGGAAAARLVFDVVYDPWPTPLAAAALTRGQTLVGGLDLLVHQAALQVELMTGRAAPVASMRTAGEAALATRAGPR